MASALLRAFKKKLTEIEFRKKKDGGVDVGTKGSSIASHLTGDKTAQFMVLLQKWHREVKNQGTKLEDAERDEIKARLRQGVDVNARSANGVPVLIMVTECFLLAAEGENLKAVACSLEIMRLLLAHGFDVNIQDKDGRTALLLGIENNSFTKMKYGTEAFLSLLLDGGARVDRESFSDNAWPTTPLIAAVKDRRVHVVEMVLAKGAKVNEKEGDDTAIYLATRASREIYPRRVSPIVSVLLQHGADIKGDESRMLTAAISHAPESVERFLAEIYGQPELQPHYLNHQGIPNKPPNDSGSNGVSKSLMGRLDQLILMDTETTTTTKSAERLCSNCQNFEKNAVYRQWFNHSPNSDVMIRSILNGCTLCQLINDCLPSAFNRVQLYLYSALSDADTLSRNYYERVIIRCENSYGVIFGELRLAAIDGMY